MDHTSILIKRRPYLRSMKLQIIPSGTVICHVSQTAKDSNINAFISSHNMWIQRQLNKLETLSKKYPNVYWSPNIQVPFLGQFKPLKVILGSAKQVLIHKDMIEVHLPHSKASQTEWSKLFQEHYKKLGIHLLRSRLEKMV